MTTLIFLYNFFKYVKPKGYDYILLGWGIPFIFMDFLLYWLFSPIIYLYLK